MNRYPFAVFTIALLLSLGSANVFAQHDHDDHDDHHGHAADIELGGTDGTTIEVEEPHHGEIWHSLEDDASTSFQEQGFVGSHEWGTSYPGFEHHEGQLTPSSTFSLKLLDRLYYFHPTDQAEFGLTPNGEIIEVTKGNEYFAWSDSGVSILLDDHDDGLIEAGTVDGDGDLHAHVNFTLVLDNATAAPADGAYLAGFELVSSDDGATEPIWALWNKGLSDSDFHLAIAAAENAIAIPEPATGGLLAGLAALAMLRRRTRHAG